MLFHLHPCNVALQHSLQTCYKARKVGQHPDTPDKQTKAVRAEGLLFVESEESKHP